MTKTKIFVTNPKMNYVACRKKADNDSVRCNDHD